MRFLLDTNVISEVGKPRPHPKVLTWLLEHESACGVPSVAVAELYQGAYGTAGGRKESLLKDIEAFVAEASDRIVPFDAGAAAAWGEYVSQPSLKHKPRSYPDSQIAAIAISRNLIVVTRNTGDFPFVETLNPFAE